MTEYMNDRLKIARVSLGLSQKEMAKKLNIGLKSWQVYEQGKSVPGGKAINALIKLGFNSNWLLSGEGEMRQGEVAYSLAEGDKNADNVEELGAKDLKKASDDLMREAIIAEIEQLHGEKLARFLHYLVEEIEKGRAGRSGQ